LAAAVVLVVYIVKLTADLQIMPGVMDMFADYSVTVLTLMVRESKSLSTAYTNDVP
jgi:hypothetical protein